MDVKLQVPPELLAEFLAHIQKQFPKVVLKGVYG